MSAWISSLGSRACISRNHRWTKEEITTSSNGMPTRLIVSRTFCTTGKSSMGEGRRLSSRFTAQPASLVNSNASSSVGTFSPRYDSASSGETAPAAI